MLLAGNNQKVHSAAGEFLQREPKLIWEKISADFAQDVQTLKSKISDILAPEDFVVFLGAGDVTRWAYQFADLIGK